MEVTGQVGCNGIKKLRDDFWSVSGIMSEWTSDEIMEIHAADPDSVRKVGSLDG